MTTSAIGHAARQGDFDLAPVRRRIEERFRDTDGCWFWNRSVKFARTSLLVWKIDGGKQSIAVHRAAYLALVGDIPEGMLVCHRCAMGACVNPAHLYLGTPSQNMRDRFSGDVLHMSDAEKMFGLSRRDVAPLMIEGTQHVRRADVVEALGRLSIGG